MYSGIRIVTYNTPYSVVWFWMTISDLEWPRKISNDMDHCTASATAELPVHTYVGCGIKRG